MITYEDFAKLEIRIGRIISAEKVPETDRLIKFTVDLGDETRTIVGGFALTYPDPTVLVGQLVPILANLAPRELRGIMSEGMILAASADNLPVPLAPLTEVPPGTVIK
jgi:methionine--tRNA ligase beta chain